LIVADPPLLLEELEPELELELELEPHAATTSDATIATAPALMRRLVNVFSFSNLARVPDEDASLGPARRPRVTEM
jgi:hypothetical protein